MDRENRMNKVKKNDKNIKTKNIKIKNTEKNFLVIASLFSLIAIFVSLLSLKENLNTNKSINENSNLYFNFLVKSNTRKEIEFNRIYCKRSNEITQTDREDTQNKEINAVKYLEVKGEGESEETESKTNWETYLKEEEDSEEKKEKKEIRFKKANRKYIILLLVLFIIFFAYIYKKFFEKDDVIFKKIKSFLGINSKDQKNYINNEFKNGKFTSNKNKTKSRKTFEENIF